MLDFLVVKDRKTRSGVEVYPDFVVGRSSDLMIRGGAFYAIWDSEKGLWSTDEYDVQRLVDKEIREYTEKLSSKIVDSMIFPKYMAAFSSTSWSQFKLFVTKLSDQYKQLDDTIVFSNTPIQKGDYVSRVLPYPLEAGPTPAFDKLFGTLYDEENLTKLMWAIGSVVSGASKYVQKFYVLFGAPGTGKSTALNLIQNLFEDYYTTFEAKTITNGTSNFSTEMFRGNPLVGINHEGDLSKIRDNSVLNSIVAHDKITMSVKYERSYSLRINTALFVATNKPVNITDAKSGLIRRLIDIRPTGATVPPEDYDILVSQMQFELGAIAHKCLTLFESLGKSYYNRYKPVDMMLRTNIFFNFVEDNYFEFSKDNYITLSRAWKVYKEWCENTNATYTMQKHLFRDEFRQYWDEFHKVKRIDDTVYRSVYTGFNTDAFESKTPVEVDTSVHDWLIMSEQPSLLDKVFSDQPAQYGSIKTGKPSKYWNEVTTKLSELNTKRLHYVLPQPQHIVIDFDLKDESGNKSFTTNVEAASKFPPTYAELSKSGQGIHLHYIYDGDVSALSRVYDLHIDVLAPVGNFSIRRKYTKSNGLEISRINTGLPLKGNQMVSANVVKTERALRLLISRNLNKEIHPATAPSVSFIFKLLNDAYESGLEYDVSDMREDILQFASHSTNQADACIRMALKAKYKSDHDDEPTEIEEHVEDALVFFDVEVFPNLLLISYKREGDGHKVNRLANPTAEEVEQLSKFKLVGFNNRRYDNHILYGCMLGFNNAQIYDLSYRIINDDSSAMFREAYNLSWVDVLDYSSTKQSLKKWQIELGIYHSEWEHPWDEPVPIELWDKVGEYCDNDVLSLELLHNHLIQDYNARLILADLSGLRVNSSTQSHAAKIIFGDNKNPQNEFNYVNLAEQFPGYTFKRGVSTYRGETVNEGGYVYAKPGIYQNVLYMDIASMHPTSIEVMNVFGPYTENYVNIKKARLAIKHEDYETAKEMFDGKLKPYLKDKSGAKDLSTALKIVINIVYGLTFARFPNPFRDDRNIDNIVAKRGSLFMVDLKHYLINHGVELVHIKTDSVKIANYKQEHIELIKEFGLRYGYQFEVEDVFDRMALINDAVLIAKSANSGKWDAVGARFAHPYVFKKLFSKEDIVFSDLTEAKSVKAGKMYIDFQDNESMFIGKVGLFCPMTERGGSLVRVNNDKRYAVTGTKDHKWLPAEMVKTNGLEHLIDMVYFNNLVDDAVSKISEFGDINIILN